MADPVTATIGTIASVVQLVDVALRLSRECYTFLHAVKGSRKHIEAASHQVNTILSVLLALKIYIDELKTEEGNNAAVPEPIAQVAHHIQDLLVDLRSIIPDDCTNLGLYRRIGWVMDTKRLRDLSQRLENEKSTLQVALQISAQYVSPSSVAFGSPVMTNRLSDVND